MRLLPVLLLIVVACTKNEGPPGPKAYSKDEVPKEWAPLVEKGDSALAELQKGLIPKLTKALSEGPPSHAVSVCQVEAPAIKAALEASQGLELGRTSHKLRNPKNAPRAWAAPFVAQAAGKKFAEVGPWVVDLGDRIGLLRPIPVGPPCVTCHGLAQGLDQTLTATLAQLYPNDQATGFAEGDLRGWFWAELKKPGP